MVINNRIKYCSGSIKLLSLDQSVTNIFIYTVWQVVLHSFICERQLPILSDTFPTLKQSILPTNNFYFETIWKPGWIALLLRERFTPINFCWKQKSCSINNLVVFPDNFTLPTTICPCSYKCPKASEDSEEDVEEAKVNMTVTKTTSTETTSQSTSINKGKTDVPFSLGWTQCFKIIENVSFPFRFKIHLNFCAKKWTQL